MGRAAITAAEPAGVVVTVDPSFIPVPPGVSCDGPGADAIEICDGNILLNSRVVSFGDTLWVRFLNRGVAAQTVILEIVPRTNGPVARIFVRYEDDAAPPDVPLSCERASSPRLDLTGVLTVNGVDISNPSDTHGQLVLDLPGGGTATIDF